MSRAQSTTQPVPAENRPPERGSRLSSGAVVILLVVVAVAARRLLRRRRFPG